MVLDGVLAACLLAGFWIGWMLRAVRLMGMLLSLVAGMIAANHWHGLLQGFAPGLPQPVERTAAWLIVFLAAAAAVSLAALLLSRVLEIVRLRWLDHLAGGALAVVLSLGILTTGLTLASGLASTFHWTFLERSRLASAMIQWGRAFVRQDPLPRLPGPANRWRGPI